MQQRDRHKCFCRTTLTVHKCFCRATLTVLLKIMSAAHRPDSTCPEICLREFLFKYWVGLSELLHCVNTVRLFGYMLSGFNLLCWKEYLRHMASHSIIPRAQNPHCRISQSLGEHLRSKPMVLSQLHIRVICTLYTFAYFVCLRLVGF